MLNDKEKYVDANLYAPDNAISGNETNSLIYVNLIDCLQISSRTGIFGMCYGKEDGKRNKQKHSYKSVAVYSVFHLPSQNTFQL